MEEDALEKEYFKLKKKFENDANKRYNTPKKLKQLADLLKYRRMKKELKKVDIDKIAKELIRDLNELYIDLMEL